MCKFHSAPNRQTFKMCPKNPTQSEKLSFMPRRSAKVNLLIISALNYFIILNFIHSNLLAVGASILFRSENAQITEKQRNERPCNFGLDYNDIHLLTPGIIAKYGYPVERHWVTTEDGYILEMHRIPRGPDKKGKPTPAIYLMHGVMSSSRDFVINCDRRALAFQLWDNGYDVWMGNYRGTTYSRNHTTLSPDALKFWSFSADEVGLFDVPAMIDHVLNTTTLKQLTYVGHSLGNGVGLIMLTLRPEYNDKVNVWFAMSAAANVQDTGSPLLRIFAAFPRSIEWALRTFNHGELFPERFLRNVRRFFARACYREGRLGDFHGLCSFIFFIGDGYDPGQIMPEMWSVIAGENPTSTSVRLLVQWMQWIINGRFAMYDEGPINNLKKYGSIQPKVYPVENMDTSMVLMWGENDWIISAADIHKTEVIAKRLARVLRKPSPVEFFKVPSPTWNHLDFIYGKDADIYVYSHILSRLKKIYPNVTLDSVPDAPVESDSNDSNNTSYEFDTTTDPTFSFDNADPLIDIRITNQNVTD